MKSLFSVDQHFMLYKITKEEKKMLGVKFSSHVSGSSQRPDFLDGSRDANVLVVKVEQTGESEGHDGVESAHGQLGQRGSVHVVGDDALEAPENVRAQGRREHRVNHGVLGDQRGRDQSGHGNSHVVFVVPLNRMAVSHCVGVGLARRAQSLAAQSRLLLSDKLQIIRIFIKIVSKIDLFLINFSNYL